MRLFWSVAVGAALGGLSRYYATAFIQQRAGADFPAGTLLVNVTGSFLIGFIMRYALQSDIVSPESRVFLTTGFCGGYTTFSTFSLETFRLVHGGLKYTALAYIAASVLCWLASVWLGHTLAVRTNRLNRS